MSDDGDSWYSSDLPDIRDCLTFLRWRFRTQIGRPILQEHYRQVIGDLERIVEREERFAQDRRERN
jgi:hypothetical protein